MFPYWMLFELRMIEVMITTGAIIHAKLQPNRHHQQTNTQLFTGRMPILPPNQQRLSSAGKSNSRKLRHVQRTGRTACHFVHQLHHANGASRHQRSWEAKEDVVRMCEKWYDYMQPGWCQPVRQEFMENECEALPGVAYHGVRDNRSTLNTTRSSADADNALDANEAVPNKWRADGTHNTYQSY